MGVNDLVTLQEEVLRSPSLKQQQQEVGLAQVVVLKEEEEEVERSDDVIMVVHVDEHDVIEETVIAENSLSEVTLQHDIIIPHEDVDASRYSSTLNVSMPQVDHNENDNITESVFIERTFPSVDEVNCEKKKKEDKRIMRWDDDESSDNVENDDKCKQNVLSLKQMTFATSTSQRTTSPLKKSPFKISIDNSSSIPSKTGERLKKKNDDPSGKKKYLDLKKISESSSARKSKTSSESLHKIHDKKLKKVSQKHVEEKKKKEHKTSKKIKSLDNKVQYRSTEEDSNLDDTKFYKKNAEFKKKCSKTIKNKIKEQIKPRKHQRILDDSSTSEDDATGSIQPRERKMKPKESCGLKEEATDNIIGK